ncbi:MAG: prepilin-type N-terminal cleavage/methylation domain-containing protein [Leptospiraceae bacterium]|nr:prepilin-type N-terminal cleavage/methylation domain-containing protein [Leptospiraceae bacterium]
MNLIGRLKRYLRRKRRAGFTLIEVLMAMAVTAMMTGLLISSVVNAMAMRQKALSLNRAITLAKKKMHEIKALNKTDSGQGEFPNMPGYRFDYVIREQELDLQKIADELGAGKEVANSAAAKFFKERNASTKSATGLTFKLLHFHVTVIYNEKEKYELDYYRGLGI